MRQQKIHGQLPFGFDKVIESIADDQRPSDRKLPARPFVKWVGGKRSILDKLVERVPDTYTRYCECFLGGGALFFEVQPEKAFLSDINFYLIIAYRAVRDDVDGVIKELKVHDAKHDKTHFLASRLRLSTEQDQAALAALLIYLNKTCYNGLYRVNKAGAFNVPIGSYTNPAIMDEETLRNASRALQGAEIQHRPFSQIEPKAGEFYYLDPPYHQTYAQYHGDGFGDELHQELAKVCRNIDAAGAKFMLSNSDTDFVRQLYKGFVVEDVLAGRYVSCKSDQRGRHSELIIRNYQRDEGRTEAAASLSIS